MRLTLILETAGESFEKGHLSMAEEWIESIAKNLIDKDTPASHEIRRREQREKLIARDAEGFFRTFAECVQHSANEIREAVSSSAVAAEQSCSVSSNGCTLTLERSKLPFITMSATFQPVTHTVAINYFSNNPEKPVGGFAHKNVPCHFEIDGDGKLFLVLDGNDFHSAKEAAKRLVTTLFTV